MATATEQVTEIETFDALLRRIGDVPLDRIRVRPAPGMATEADVCLVNHKAQRLCELVEGVLVEKAMGYREALLESFLIKLLRNFIDPLDLGLVTGSSGLMRLSEGLVRIPDVAFISWGRVPGGKVPIEPIPDLAPDLAVEVISPSNTAAEMALKRREYLDASVRLIWYVDPKARTVLVIRPDREDLTLDESGTLDGEDVIPGFSVDVRTLFADLDRRTA